VKYLFDFGEGLFCFVPVFMIIALVFGALIWNNLPSRMVKKAEEDDDLK
jgi:hypothetical protein